MLVEECTSITEWNTWLLATTIHTPLVAHGQWGQLLEREGSRVRYFFVREHKQIIAGFYLIIIKKRFFSHAYSPRGPIVVAGTNLLTAYHQMINFVKKLPITFWRIEPNLLPQPLLPNIRKTIDVQPSTTLLLDLKKSSEELLAAMHHKTRYNIRLALKKNLEVRFGKNAELFWHLSVATSERDGFRLHSKEHYDQVIASDFTEQITVYNEGTPVASAVCTYVGTTYTYLFGASSYEARALMAPYLIQWSAISRGKECGAQWYDFYGLSPVHPPVHEQQIRCSEEYAYDTESKEAGYTRFKLGFGGHVIINPGTWEVILQPFYYHIFRLAKIIRRMFFKK
jgi:lipid II:glycine glycyltransferase (peptidoglycan interpeptide bridge formation enzyme)